MKDTMTQDYLGAEVSAGALLGLPALRPIAVRRNGARTETDVAYYRCQVAQEQGKPCEGCVVHDRRPAKRCWPDVPHRGPVGLRPVPVRLRKDGCTGMPGEPECISPRFNMTKSAAAWILLESMDETFARVADKVGCAAGRPGQIFAAIRPALDAWQPSELPRRIGIDGVHTHDGTYTVIAGLEPNGKHKGEVLELLDTHDPKKVKEKLENWPGRDTVEVVALDPSSSLREVVRAVFPNARLVVDKRHVQRRGLTCAHAVRKRHAGAIDKKRSRNAAEAPAKKALARALDKRVADLNEADHAVIAAAGPLVGLAYTAKEQFSAIYDSCHAPSEAADAVEAWWRGLDPALLDFFRPAYLLVSRTWGAEFREYFRVSPRVTTAFVEACNRTLRGFEADARGNAGHARLRAQMLFRFGALSADQLTAWLAAAL
ncbi:MAG: ISL3 family transposase [Actinomycetota bacterium]